MSLLTTDRVAFRECLPEGGRLIGMDVGTKTIGLALCDDRWSIASPAHTINRGKFTKDKIAIAAFIAQQQVKGIVIGLPLNLDGTGSPRSQSSRAFAQNLTDLGLPILLWDERWSTQAAEAAMIGQDMSRAKRAAAIDSHAAAVILQGAIDRLAGGVL